MKPIIGIVPLYDLEKKIVWMLPDYMKSVEAAGGLPIILDLTGDKTILAQEAGMCQGFLFAGGEDVNPALYRQDLHEKTGPLNPLRDQMEVYLMNQVLVRDKPLLGICRGHQLLNVISGGTLVQDLPALLHSPIQHRQAPPYSRPVHEVDIIEGTPLYELLRQKHLQVNSIHHQGVDRLGDRLQIMARSQDQVAEAICGLNHKFVWGIQWHPERMPQEESSRKIFGRFVDACKKG